MELLMEHLGNGLVLSLMLSLPCVLTAALVGLVVGILQAVTQVQEQTISAAPKILSVFLLIILGGGLMMTLLTNYTREAVQIAFNEVPQNGIFVLPPQSHQSEGQTRARQFFNLQATGGGGNAGKLKEMAEQWRVPDEAGSSGNSYGILKTAPATGTGNALGPAERMMLEKGKN